MSLSNLLSIAANAIVGSPLKAIISTSIILMTTAACCLSHRFRRGNREKIANCTFSSKDFEDPLGPAQWETRVTQNKGRGCAIQ